MQLVVKVCVQSAHPLNVFVSLDEVQYAHVDIIICRVHNFQIVEVESFDLLCEFNLIEEKLPACQSGRAGLRSS